MRNILLAILVYLFVSCGQNPGQLAADRNNMIKAAYPLIKNYYKDIYSKGARTEETNTDSTARIVYYNIPGNKDDYDGYLVDITIPKKTGINLYESNSILFGDLDHDNKEEMVMTVHTEGGGGGGNTASQDIFVFRRSNDSVQILCTVVDASLANCADGMFRAKKIEKGLIIGMSSCYKEDDARCCPSVQLITTAGLSGNTLNPVKGN